MINSATNLITMKNKKLTVGMTRESMYTTFDKMGLNETDKAAKKLMEAFEKADGIVDGVKDNVISEKEIEVYDKEMRKKNWRTGLLVAAGVVVAGVATYLITKSIKSNRIKQLAAMQMNMQNIMNVDTAEEIGKIAQEEIGAKTYRVAIAGYSAPPEGYEGPTKEFMKKLKEMLGGDKTAFAVTSPTASVGSIDAITTEVAGLEKGNIFYTTSQEYLKFIDPDNLPAGIDREAYSKLVKYVLPNKAEYSRATAEVSNIFLATGGRNATISDFVNAVKKGNKAVILNNLVIDSPAWSGAMGNAENASKYIIEQFEAFKAGKELPYPEVGEFTREFMSKNLERLNKLVKMITFKGSDQASIAVAAQETAHFLA